MIMAYDCSHSAVKARYFMIYCEHVIQLVKGGNTQKVCFSYLQRKLDHDHLSQYSITVSVCSSMIA